MLCPKQASVPTGSALRNWALAILFASSWSAGKQGQTDFHSTWLILACPAPFCKLILTTEQLCLAPWQTAGLKWNSHFQMLKAWEGVMVAHQGGRGATCRAGCSASQTSANSEVRACFAPGLSCVRYWKNPDLCRHLRMWGQCSAALPSVAHTGPYLGGQLS